MIEMTLVEKFSEDEQFDGMIFADGFDDAFIGIVYDIAPKAVYNRQKVIEIIIQDDFDTGCTWEEAEEHFEFNIVRGCQGAEQAPIFVTLVEDLEHI
jgi:hypothetical protein